MSLLFKLIISMLYISSTNNSNTRIRMSMDIWHQIIIDWMDITSLICISKVDTNRNKILIQTDILKQRIHERNKQRIEAIIKELQWRNNSVLNSHKRFITSQPNKLIKQYLLGFDGELDHILIDMKHQHKYLMNKSEISWTISKIMHLKLLIIDYKQKYLTSESIKISNNETVMITFKQFITMQNKCQHLLSIIEHMFGEYMDQEREMICGMKLMMQWIGLKLKYPGIIPFHRHDIDIEDYIRLWMMIRSDLFIWKRLLDLDTYNLNDRICSTERKLQNILKSNNNSTQLIDEFISFLDDLYQIYFVKDIADFL